MIEPTSEVVTMDAPTERKAKEWLTREQINEIVAAISTDDLIESGLTETSGDSTKAVKAMRDAFNLAAESIGLSNGVVASKLVRATDLTYWSEALSAAVDVDSPKRDAPEPLHDSVASGE